jgi:hypothetical protein
MQNEHCSACGELLTSAESKNNNKAGLAKEDYMCDYCSMADDISGLYELGEDV